MLDLVLIELTKVLHVDFRLLCIDNSRKAVQLDVFIMQVLHSDDDIAQLADAGRLDDDALRCVFLDDLIEGAAEVADQRAADAAGVHLVDLHTGFLKESAVNADLAELILDQNELLVAIRTIRDQFLDQRCLAGTQKPGENIYFCHIYTFFLRNRSLAFRNAIYYSTSEKFLWKSMCDSCIIQFAVESYRSGHNEPHSKCGGPHGPVGSNPTLSARSPSHRFR